MPGPTLPIDSHAEALIRLYRQAALELLAQVEANLAQQRRPGTTAWQRAQLRRVLTLLAELGAAGDPYAAAVVGEAYSLGVRAVDAAGIGTRVAFSGIHQQAVNVIARNLQAQLGEARITVGRLVADLYRQAGLEAAGLHLAAGSTLPQAQADLLRRLRRRGLTAFIDKAGRRWRLETYAQMVIRTTTREAVSHGTWNRLQENGGETVQISDHNTTTPLCQEYEGNVYRLPGATSRHALKLPELDRLPPFHPNCKHTLGAGPLLSELEAGAPLGDVPATPAAPVG